MVNVGIIGLGMMGNTHLDVYMGRDDVHVAAIADLDEDRLHGRTKAGGNIEGQASGSYDLSKANRYRTAEELIADDAVQLIDICVPTPEHLRVGLMALESGKHVLMEKPLARTHDQAVQLVEAAKSAQGLTMPAMCMRFWPGWTWLKQRIDDGQYGKLLSIHFRRVASHPGGNFYLDGDANGGALLDLHIHDADAIQWLLGMPASVHAMGHGKLTGNIDYVASQYHYPDGPIVSAEGGWSMAEGFGFSMQYLANFEKVTAQFDIAASPWLKLSNPDGTWRDVQIAEGMGYAHELDYFLKCIAEGKAPQTVTFADAAESVRLIEAERRSIEQGSLIAL